ncbi:Prefoldin beta-like protein [Neocallimastix californiae]|uniref:Prefoldin beta-like protein n=1 Tax=Neocallimastix californiae TaxID=1754190 RepID=A0A1Y2F4E5_9FUNG|nr:Prefoldin beta-like protein [Neocallimastix californiae]|eukprot:ORY78354.1 Prefoldin beta-like protein [Neocallimastix californiae]
MASKSALEEQLEKIFSKSVTSRQQLESQKQENESIQQEFKELKEDAVIYKMIGPVLVKQDKAEATQNVDKRLEYINGEIKRIEKLIKELEEKQEKKKNEVASLQLQFQQQKQAAATKA